MNFPSPPPPPPPALRTSSIGSKNSSGELARQKNVRRQRAAGGDLLSTALASAQGKSTLLGG